MQVWLRLLAGVSVGGWVACGGNGEHEAALTAEGAGQGDTDSSTSASSGGESKATPRMSSDGTAAELPGGNPSSAKGAANPEASERQQGAAPAVSGEPPTPLPDLVLDEAYLLDTTRFDLQRIDDPCAVQQGCATGLGERRVVRFGARMGNVGNADFVLGVPERANPIWTLEACSDRFSLGGFARYELRDAQSGALVLVGSKSEFCMTDAEQWIPESGAQCHTYSCRNQGIRPGCADNYGTDLPCQWLDITDVPPGDYELLVTVNAARAVAEQDYANDSVRLRLRIDAAGGSVVR